jgi:hypothetical protein
MNCTTHHASVVYPDKCNRDWEVCQWQEELTYRVSLSEETMHGAPVWVLRAIRWCLYLSGRRKVMPLT